VVLVNGRVAGKVTVGLAVHWPSVRLQWSDHVLAQSLGKRDKHSASAPVEVFSTLYLSARTVAFRG